jgi:hypothetical protein
MIGEGRLTARSMHAVTFERQQRRLSAMLWFFRRAEHTTAIELRFEEEAGEFVMTLTRDDGDPQTERFALYEAFADRVTTLETRLSSDGWQQQGAPIVLPTGWRTVHKLTRH